MSRSSAWLCVDQGVFYTPIRAETVAAECPRKSPRASEWRGFAVAIQNSEFLGCGQARESSDNPILKALCRVAPSDRFSFLAIFAAGAFLRAIDFCSRTCTDVQENA
jgi:hypothetical protein